MFIDGNVPRMGAFHPAGQGGLIPAVKFIRVSTDSQDEKTQHKYIDAFAPANGYAIVDEIILRGYSASKGEQEPALQRVIADIQSGKYRAVIVTESRSLDRREDVWAQLQVIMAIRLAGGEVVSISEPTFGKDDFGSLIGTVVSQKGNADKSRIVKDTTYRGIRDVRDNLAHHGALPMFWSTRGERYHKQAYCTDPGAVRDIYERADRGESRLSIANVYDCYPQSVKNLLRFAANHTGVIECSYTYEGIAETIRDTWHHQVEPVVDSALWWRVNKRMEKGGDDDRANKGGRPVARPANWLSGVLDCPGCGGRLFIKAGLTPAGNPRTPKLHCGGNPKSRRACGNFKGTDALPVIGIIESMMSRDETPLLAFQRVAGNQHELDELNASLQRAQASLSTITDRQERRDALAAIERTEDAIEAFTVVPDDYDYAETGRTVAGMWNEGDEGVKRSMVRAIKKAWGMNLALHDDRWVIFVGRKGADEAEDTSGIVDLGNGLCFRRPKAS